MAKLKRLGGSRRPFHQGLRFKLGLVSLTLLAIPWAGYRYLTETESFLRQAQEENLLDRAEMVARLVSDTALPLLQRHAGRLDQPLANTLYAHPLPLPVQLDGYAEEWESLLEQRRHFRASETAPDALAFDLLLAYREQTLYLYVQVGDGSRRYALADSEPASGDHLQLALPDGEGGTRKLLIGTSAPGWVAARDSLDGRQVREIRGEWQETAQGYDVELRLPIALTGPQRSISLAVVDRQTDGTSQVAASSGLERVENLSTLLFPSVEIQRLLDQSGKEGIRSLVLTAQRQVIGRAGELAPASGATALSFLERLLGLLPAFTPGEPAGNRARLGRLDGPEIRQALAGAPSTYRYHADAGAGDLLSAAYPLGNGRRVNGVVVIEQNSQGILSLRQQALARLLEISLVLFLFTGLSLLAFSSRLTGRITRLSHGIERSVSGEGRINHGLPPNRETDEIGDLARSFAAVMSRLQEYNRYLEAMSARLAHELRTPLTLAKSSLENLAQVDAEADRERYLQRANQGLQRLSLILERMREASRLEQALQLAEWESTDLAQLTGAMCEAYRSAYPDVGFECRLPDRPVVLDLAPDLIVQALDKLVGNAVDFHLQGTPVVIAVEFSSSDRILLRVINQGPPLPEGMGTRLFDSMVSIRKGHDDQPHLGLGLYLVRLIAEYHQGDVSAENLESGVCFTLRLPLQRDHAAS